MNPIQEIIPRFLDSKIEKVLEEFGTGIDQLVDFGSNIIAWDVQKNDGGEEDLPPILFLRNFIEEIDAISILVRKSSIDSCNNLLRTALENFFSVCYLIEKDFKQRSMAFLICNSLNHRRNIKKADGISEEFKRMVKIYGKDKLVGHTNPFIIPDANDHLKNNQDFLDLPKYKFIKNEYYLTKRKLKRKPAWYSLFDGPTNLEILADKLGYPAIYEIFYRGWSTSVHGADILQGKISGTSDNKAEIFQIRLPNSAQSVTQHCFNLSIILYSEYLQKRIPNRLNDFRKWYKTISQFNLSLSKSQIINIED